ncbi:MAG: YidC/Oxa1 family membrane protein insertase [Oscillospiraceae bacterium]|nr:YidC/Oxa1 family membrane protein insertase [Oscillospiraceae bacterium]
MHILGVPLGWVMKFIYGFIQNYGLSIIVFTILVKLLMLPMAVKQQKSQAKMAVVQPQMLELQKRYANNQQKLQEELAALYAREGYNPTSGCLTLFIQFPIIMGLYDVIYKPLTHVLALGSETLTKATEIATSLGMLPEKLYSAEPYIISAVQNDPAAFEALGADIVSKIQNFDMYFLGINLGDTPTMAFNALLLIPILSFASQMLMTVISFRNNNTGSDNPSMAGMKATMYMMPFLSAWICFSVPAGVGMYWIVSSVLSLLQMVILNKFYNPKEMAEKARIESERRRELEKAERARRREEAKAGEAEAKRKALSQKEINRQKLAEARRRDAEKYGEVYVEVTDKDLE